MKALIFFDRMDKRDKLTEASFSRFGKVKHFENLGMIRDREALDLRGIHLFFVNSVRGSIKKISEPVYGRKIVVYYVET